MSSADFRSLNDILRFFLSLPASETKKRTGVRQTENAEKCIIRLHTKIVCPVIVINTYHAVTFCYCLIYFFRLFHSPFLSGYPGAVYIPRVRLWLVRRGDSHQTIAPCCASCSVRNSPFAVRVFCSSGVSWCLLLIYCFEKHLSSFCVFYCAPPFMSFPLS